MDPREASIREYTPEEIADPHALKAYHEKVDFRFIIQN